MCDNNKPVNQPSNTVVTLL